MRVDARRVLFSVFKGLLIFSLVATGRGQTPPPVYKAVGAVVSIEPTGFTLQTDSGTRLTVLLSNNAILLRVAPNQKDLKSATKINAQDISVGDRVLVRGHISDDQKTLLATAAIDMSKGEIAQRHEAERLEWQRGVGGLVGAVDPATSTITISTTTFGTTKKVVVHVSKDTILRRYAPDSVKFEDAKAGTLNQIQPGDQLRARGTRSEDGNDFAAEEIVSGSFRNIAGTVSLIDISQNTLSVLDLKSKKPLLVKFTADSQIRKMDPTMAQGIAMRLKGGAAGGSPNAPGGGGNALAGRPSAGGPPAGGGPGGPQGGPGGPRPGGAPDFQRILSRMPQATLADLKKGDAVMIVATQGTASSGITAITLLSGVEPILTASPSAGQAMFMAGWNLGGAPSGGGGEEGTQ
jgi:hypothetical protein